MLIVPLEWWNKRILYSRGCWQFFLTRLIPLGPEGLDSCGLIDSCDVVPYFFGDEGYGECWGRFDISCWYFCNHFLMYLGMEIYTYYFCMSLLWVHFSVMPQYNPPVQSSYISWCFSSAEIRWSAYYLSIYFTPKSSTTRRKFLGMWCVFIILGCVWLKNVYVGKAFILSLFFESAPACGSPYTEHMISIYMYSFFAFYLKLYCCTICSGNADRGIRIYPKRYNRVQR